MGDVLDRLTNLVVFPTDLVGELHAMRLVSGEASIDYKTGKSFTCCPPYRDERMRGAWLAGWITAHTIHHEARPAEAVSRCPPRCHMIAQPKGGD
jgi:hypothetical protein